MATAPYDTDVNAPARRDHYNRVQIALHWLIAGLIAFELALGWRHEDLPRELQGALFALHKPIGITILTLMAVRLVWRATYRVPPLPGTMAPWERALALSTHYLFYVLFLLIPVGGWIIVSSGATPKPIDFGLFSVPALPGLAGNETLKGIAEFGHGWGATIAAVFIGLHVLGGLKHQFIDRDDDFGRIAPFAHRTLSAAMIGAIAIIGVVFLWGKYQPLTALATPVGTQGAPIHHHDDAPAPEAPMHQHDGEHAH